jgi:hypothetical protein
MIYLYNLLLGIKSNEKQKIYHTRDCQNNSKIKYQIVERGTIDTAYT